MKQARLQKKREQAAAKRKKTRKPYKSYIDKIVERAAKNMTIIL